MILEGASKMAWIGTKWQGRSRVCDVLDARSRTSGTDTDRPIIPVSIVRSAGKNS